MINWERVWTEFDVWYNSRRISGGLLDWEGQQTKIQQLVNAQVRENNKESNIIC